MNFFYAVISTKHILHIVHWCSQSCGCACDADSVPELHMHFSTVAKSHAATNEVVLTSRVKLLSSQDGRGLHNSSFHLEAAIVEAMLDGGRGPMGTTICNIAVQQEMH